MDALAFRRDLEARGFRLWIEAQADGPLLLRVAPASALLADDRAAIRVHRDELVAMVAFSRVWAILTNALERRRAGKLPLHSKDFREALVAYEQLSTALGPDVSAQLEQLALA
jgi:hypothetical protein